MKWKFWQKDPAPESQEVEAQEPEKIIDTGSLSIGISPVPTKKEPTSEWGPDELGVESLYLPFGVRKGWADGKIDTWTPEKDYQLRSDALESLTARPYSLYSYSASKKQLPTVATENLSSPNYGIAVDHSKLPTVSCGKLLYRRLEGKRTDGSDILEPSKCRQEHGHEGKHGLDGVEYLHPDEYPNRVGVKVETTELDRLASLIQQATWAIEAMRSARDL